MMISTWCCTCVVILLIVMSTVTGFYISDATRILFYDEIENKISTLHEQANGRIVGLTFDTIEGRLFWSDISDNFRGIYTASTEESGRLRNITRIIRDDLGEVNGLTVDFVSQHIYWTDAVNKGVYISDYAGEHRQLLPVKTNTPRGVVADPETGYLFWTDQGSHTIERSSLDGSNHVTLVDSDVFWPNQLTIYNSEIFWVDAWLQALMVCDLDGRNVHNIATLSSLVDLSPIFGLTIENNQAFIGVWHSGTIITVDIATQEASIVKRSVGLDLFSFATSDRARQNSGLTSPCPAFSPCSHICIPVTTDTYRCSCPMFSGLALANDQHTCQEPSAILLYASADDGYVAMKSTENTQSIDRHVIARSSRPTAVTYDEIQKKVYWSDVKERAIYVCDLDGSNQEVLLRRNESLGLVEGLAIDASRGHLYFTNTDVVTSGGVLYSWHRIEMMDVSEDGYRKQRRIIITEAEKPRGLHLDLTNNHLYFTDWGSSASVWRSNLDGTGLTSILQGLDSPNSVLVSDDTMYVLDSMYKSKQPANGLLDVNNGRDQSQRARLYVKRGSENFQTLLFPGEELPFRMTLDLNSRRDTMLYISDWKSNSIKKYNIHGTDLNEQLTYIDNLATPMGILNTPVTTTTRASSCANSCTDEELCLSTGQDRQCLCSSFGMKSFIGDQMQCSVPSDYVLVSDVKSIKFQSLTGADKSTYNLLEGCNSNYVAMSFNSRTNTYYYSDNNRRQILSSTIDTGVSSVVADAVHIVDSLLFVEQSSMLYWVDYLTGNIMSKSIDRANQPNDIVTTQRSKPKSLAYDESNQRLYWCEYGSNPGIYFINIINLVIEKVKVEGDISAVTIDAPSNSLYMFDASTNHILQCQLDGEDCDIIHTSETIFDVYNLQLSENKEFLFFSSWSITQGSHGTSRAGSSNGSNGHISMLHINTGRVIPIVVDLMRPTEFVFKFTQQSRCPSDAACSHQCIPTVGDRYICTCPDEQTLGENGHSCITIPQLWYRVPTHMCTPACTEHSACSRHGNAYTTTCQCLPGYEKRNNQCMACPRGTFSGTLGDGGCIPCPTSSMPHSNGKECVCNGDRVWDIVSQACRVNKSGTCPAAGSCDDQSCVSNTNCQSDDDCEGAQKCCDSDTRDSQCRDPIGMQQCVYLGVAYNSGEHFTPNSCTTCTCEADKTKGDPRYGDAHCRTETCPPVYCQEEFQYQVSGSCCVRCPITSIAFAQCDPLVLQNCPHTHLDLTLPEDQGYMDVDPLLRATDYTRLRRPVTFTRQPDVTRFWWSEAEVVHNINVSIQAWSPDGHMDADSCHYSITLKDEVPPVVKCPVESYIYTHDIEHTPAVWGPPTATDNVQVKDLMSTGTQFYDWLEEGRHQITYRAVDKADNPATCQFNVHVIRLGLPCASIPTLLNGRLSCDDQQCLLRCALGYQLNPLMDLAYAHQCQNGEWIPAVPDNINILACVRTTDMVWNIHTSFVFISHNPKTTNSDVLVSTETTLQYYLSGYPSLSVSVQEKRDDQDASNRLPRSLATRQGVLQHHQVDVIMASVFKEELQSVLNWMEADIVAGRFSIAGNGERLSAVPPFIYTEIKNGCLPGQQYAPDVETCVICPVGTFWDSDTLKCKLCPEHTYQDHEGSTECISCLSKKDKPTIRGAYIVDMCIKGPTFSEVSQKDSSMPKLTLILIIVAAVAVLLIMVSIITYIIIRRQKRKLKPDANEILPADSNRLQFSNEIYMESSELPPREVTSNIDDVIAGATGPEVDDGLPSTEKMPKLTEDEQEKTTPYSSLRIK